MLARFLVAAPPEPERQWPVGRNASAPDMAELIHRFRDLRALDLPDDELPRALDLSPQAEVSYGKWFGNHQSRRRDTEPGPFRAALSKLEEVPGRLALILALADAEDPSMVTEVDDNILSRSIALTDWFVAEAERVYRIMTETPETRAERELVEWIAQRREGATMREIVRGHSRYRCKGGTAEAQVDLDRLVSDGKLDARDRGSSPKGGRATVSYHALGHGDTTPVLASAVLGEIEEKEVGDGDTTPLSPLGSEGCVTVTDVASRQNVSEIGCVTNGDTTTYEGEL